MDVLSQTGWSISTRAGVCGEHSVWLAWDTTSSWLSKQGNQIEPRRAERKTNHSLTASQSPSSHHPTRDLRQWDWGKVGHGMHSPDPAGWG